MLWAWGQNTSGQLGPATTQNTPQQVGTATTWQSATACTAHSIALRTDGTLWGCGTNNDGQLASSPANPLPLYIPDLSPVLATAAPTATAAWVLAPNPAHEQVQLRLPVGPVTLRVYDAQGRLVHTTATATLGLRGIAPGL
jgi:hypothetical protein